MSLFNLGASHPSPLPFVSLDDAAAEGAPRDHSRLFAITFLSFPFLSFPSLSLSLSLSLPRFSFFFSVETNSKKGFEFEWKGGNVTVHAITCVFYSCKKRAPRETLIEEREREREREREGKGEGEEEEEEEEEVMFCGLVCVINFGLKLDLM